MIGIVTKLLAARKLVGRHVLKIDCRGCMASDRHIEAVGVVEAIKYHSDIWPSETSHNDSDRLHAVCRVIKIRHDQPDEFFYPCVEDGDFGNFFEGPSLLWLR